MQSTLSAMALALAIVTITALPAAGAEGDVITNVLIHKLGETEIKRYDIRSGDEILVHKNEVIEFPYAGGDQILFLIDGDHLVIQFPGELGFLTLLNFQKYLTDPDTAAHIEWGLGGKTVVSVEDVFSQLSPAAGGTEGMAGIVPEAGEVTAGSSRDAANTFGDPQFGTPFDLNVFDPGPQARSAPGLPADEPFIPPDEPIETPNSPDEAIDNDLLGTDPSIGISPAITSSSPEIPAQQAGPSLPPAVRTVPKVIAPAATVTKRVQIAPAAQTAPAVQVPPVQLRQHSN